MNPLDGLKILDLTRLLPGAVCTMLLADMGATVIKIEDPHGGDYARWMPPHIDGSSVFFRMNNRAKRSLVLDLKTAEGVAVLKRLARDADVLIESFRPGVMARLGVDYETLKADNPRLIYCALSGWGSDGPWASVSGHDLNYATAAGLVGAMQTPQPLGGQVADIGGALAAVAAINAALLRRERGGGGGGGVRRRSPRHVTPSRLRARDRGDGEPPRSRGVDRGPRRLTLRARRLRAPVPPA